MYQIGFIRSMLASENNKERKKEEEDEEERENYTNLEQSFSLSL